MPEPGSSKTALRWIPLGLFLLIPGILVYSAVGSGQFLSGTDLLGGFYALRGSVANALAGGRLPLWEPHVMAGFPLFAAAHSAALYPPNWITLVLPVGAAWTLSAWLHLALAGLFARLWLRRGLGIGEGGATAGGLLFMLSGFIIAHLYGGHTNHVWAYPWIPALLWRLERLLAVPTLKRALQLAVVLAMLFLAGMPPYVFYVGLVVLARLLQFVLAEREGRTQRVRGAGYAVGSLGFGLLFCAPQLLPTLELIGQGQRVSVNNYEFVTSFSVAPGNLFTLIAPTFFGDGREVPFWAHGFIMESQGFVGLAGLALAGLGVAGKHPQRFLWAGLALLGGLLALGHYSPVFKAFYHLVPGASLFRVPARYLLLFTIGVTVLAALGFDRLWKGDESLRLQVKIVAGLASAVLLVAGGLRLSLPAEEVPGPGWWTSLVEQERAAYKAEQGMDGPPASRAMAAKSLLWATLCAAAVAGSLLIRPGPASAAALGLLLVGELWAFNARYFTGHAVDDMKWPPEFVANVKNHPRAPFRIATVTMAQTPEIGKCQASGLDHVGGFDPMMLRRYTQLANVARGKPASDLVVTMALARPGPLFDLLGARYWIVPGPRREPPGWRAVGELPSGVVYENPAALPRAFLVGKAVNLISEEERLAFMVSPDFNARRLVVTERDSGALPNGGDASKGRVGLAKQEAGLYEFVVESPEDAYLVLTEAWYPGWTAQVDGVGAELLRADHLFQALRLPAGKHQVRFEYHSTYLGRGWAIALVAILIPVGLAAYRRRSRAA